MADELNLDLDENNNEELTRTKKRIETLSEKFKLSEQEKADLAKAKDELTQQKADAERERDFLKSFNQVSSKYQGANDFQDKIWEKVKAGYDVEDATAAILVKEGKYQTPAQPIERESPIGGSASTGITDDAEKTYDSMSRDELKQKLKDADAKGELIKAFRGKL